VVGEEEDGGGEGEVGDGGNGAMVVVVQKPTSAKVEDQRKLEEKTVVLISILDLMIAKNLIRGLMLRKSGRMKMGRAFSWGTRKRSPWSLGTAGRTFKACR